MSSSNYNPDEHFSAVELTERDAKDIKSKLNTFPLIENDDNEGDYILQYRPTNGEVLLRIDDRLEKSSINNEYASAREAAEDLLE